MAQENVSARPCHSEVPQRALAFPAYTLRVLVRSPATAKIVSMLRPGKRPKLRDDSYLF